MVFQQNIGNGAGVLPDSLVSGLAAGMLQQQGENYFQRGQAFVQSKMGFLSSSNLQYHFNIDKTYGELQVPTAEPICFVTGCVNISTSLDGLHAKFRVLKGEPQSSSVTVQVCSHAR